MKKITESKAGGIATPGEEIFINGYHTTSPISAHAQNQITQILSERSLTTYKELKNLLESIGQSPDDTNNDNQLATELIAFIINIVYPIGKIIIVRETEPFPQSYIPNTKWVELSIKIKDDVAKQDNTSTWNNTSTWGDTSTWGKHDYMTYELYQRIA